MPPAPDGTPPPPGRPRRVGLIAAAIASLAVLAIAATFVVLRPSSEEVASSPTTEVAPPTTGRTGAGPSTTEPEPTVRGSRPGADVQADVAEITRFVEDARGLTFDQPVPVVALASDDFTARVLAEFESERATLEAEGALLRAGGIVEPEVDVVQSQLDLLGDGVLGFYDPTTGELVVRSDSAGPMVRSVIAHELTHALDDQHFELDRPELTARGDGSDWAFLALVEGSAKRVENAYIAQLSAADSDQLAADQLELGIEQMDMLLSTPLVLAQIQMSPYDYGAPFVDQLVAAGGTARLDEAFDSPPVSSEQILDIGRFDGDRPVGVDRPPADGEVLDDGVLGQLLTGFLLTDSSGLDGLVGGIDPAQLDDLLGGLDAGELQDMLDELEGSGGLGGSGDLGGLGGGGALASGFGPVPTTPGWGGDHYVVWSAEDTVCVRVDWVMDTPDALATFRTAVQAWAARDAAVVVTAPSTDSVRATRCAPSATSTSGTR